LVSSVPKKKSRRDWGSSVDEDLERWPCIYVVVNIYILIKKQK
jgi:hypothetical protein